MAETTEKRKLICRPAEERIAEIDTKINAHKEAIKKLEQKKESIQNPKPRVSKAAKTKLLITKAKDAGLTDEEIDALLEKAISKKAAKTEE